MCSKHLFFFLFFFFSFCAFTLQIASVLACYCHLLITKLVGNHKDIAALCY